MKAFTKDEYQRISKLLEKMHADIMEQENDIVKMSGVRAIIDGIKTDVYDAECYDLPMLMTEGQLHALTMLYTGINKYRAQISDIIWEVYFRNVEEK